MSRKTTENEEIIDTTLEHLRTRLVSVDRKIHLAEQASYDPLAMSQLIDEVVASEGGSSTLIIH